MKMMKIYNDEVKTVHEAFVRFMLFCHTKNLSEKTIEYYLLHYNLFVKWLSEKASHEGEPPFDDVMKISDIDIETVQFYIRHLQRDCHIEDVTIATYMRAIRAFLYYCMKQGYMNRFDITIPKSVKKIKPTYSNEELKSLLKKPNMQKANYLEYQTWVLINYLLSTGNRLNTVINLQIKDIDLDNQLIAMTTTKNRKQQIIPMSDSLKTVLQEFLLIRKKNGCKPDDFLFCTIHGNQCSARAIQDEVIRYNHSRGVQPTGIHMFRHTFAKLYILNGGGTFQLQKLLGHSDLQITKEYVNMFGTDLQKNYSDFNPLDTIKQNKKMTL
jgi:integrase/recombinase XerD